MSFWSEAIESHLDPIAALRLLQDDKNKCPERSTLKMAPIEGEIIRHGIGEESFRVNYGESLVIEAAGRRILFTFGRGPKGIFAWVTSETATSAPITIVRYDQYGEPVTTLTKHKGGRITEELKTGETVEIKSELFDLKARMVSE
jgi:hypothetical protein